MLSLTCPETLSRAKKEAAPSQAPLHILGAGAWLPGTTLDGSPGVRFPSPPTST